MWNERLKLAAYCPLCGSRSLREAQLLGGTGETQLFHVTCKRCAASVLTLTLVRASGAGAVGLVTDLSADDAVRFVRTPAISTNDALQFHTFLKASPLSAWVPLPSVRRRTSSTKRCPAPKRRVTRGRSAT